MALGLLGGVASAQGDEVSSEVHRAGEGVREAKERADRFRKSGRDDLAKLADELADARLAVAEQAERVLAAERDANDAEEAQLEALKQLDRSVAVREERRDRMARLAYQLAQAESEAKAPVIVSMPKTRKSAPRSALPPKKGGTK